jgi:hypothetical protein
MAVWRRKDPQAPALNGDRNPQKATPLNASKNLLQLQACYLFVFDLNYRMKSYFFRSLLATDR